MAATLAGVATATVVSASDGGPTNIAFTVEVPHGPITARDHEMAMNTFAMCLAGHPATIDVEADADLSGLLSRVGIAGDNPDELRRAHDECYFPEVFAVDRAYQVEIEARLDEFYETMNSCIAESVGGHGPTFGPETRIEHLELNSSQRAVVESCRS